MSINIHDNQLHDIYNNELKFDFTYTPYNVVNNHQNLANLNFRKGKRAYVTHNYCLTCRWDSGSNYIMSNKKHIKPFKDFSE